MSLSDHTALPPTESERLREAGQAVIDAWDAMDGTEDGRGALMGAFGLLRLALKEPE